MPSENNNILPVSTAPNQPTTNSPKSVDWPPAKRPAHRPCLLTYCSFIVATLALIAIAILILSFTVYKVKEPTMRLNSVNFDQLDVTKNNATVVADVSVKNPNAVPFKFKSSKTILLYRGKDVGLAHGPPGNVGPHRTLRANMTVEIITDRLLEDSNFFVDVQNGSLGLQTSTIVGGKVTILGVFKRHVDVMMNCSVNVSVSTQAILGQHCTQQIWL